jgi:hypothetical protein
MCDASNMEKSLDPIGNGSLSLSTINGRPYCFYLSPLYQRSAPHNKKQSDATGFSVADVRIPLLLSVAFIYLLESYRLHLPFQWFRSGKMATLSARFILIF